MGMECRQSDVGLDLGNDLSLYSPFTTSSFEPSSVIKIVVYRGFGTTSDLLSDIVVQHESKAVDLLENSVYNVRYIRAMMLTTI